MALLKSLPQRPRSRLVPLPEYAARVRRPRPPFGDGEPARRAAAGGARARRSLAVQRTDFKLEQLAPHLFMNLRVVDEHGRQLGMGAQPGGAEGRARRAGALGVPGAGGAAGCRRSGRRRRPQPPRRRERGAAATPRRDHAPDAPRAAPAGRPQRYTAWTFGELPELMEVRQGGQTLVGFPALIDNGDARRDRGLRRARRRRRASTAPACAAWSRCRSRDAAQVPREEHPRSAEDGGGLHAARHAPRSCARRSSTSRSTAPSSPSRCRPTRPPSSARVDEGRGAADADRATRSRAWPASCWPSTPRRCAS